MDYTILIGGEAGQGLQTIGGALSKLFSRIGYHVFSHQDYMSRIRGGHNFYQLRFSDSQVMSSRQKADIIVALDLNTIEEHKEDITENGIIIYDAYFIKKTFDSQEFLNVPFNEIAVEKGGDKIMSNTAAIGAVLGMLGIELTILEDIIHKSLKKKSEDIINKNILTARAGHEYAVKNCKECRFSVTASSDKGFMLIDSSAAVGLGAIMSGCKFYAAYPMTPSTAVMNYIASKAQPYGIVVEQAEDEICAINMALGASFAGVRSMTGTSGGGFSLMCEGVSLAGMMELPIVILEAQRVGPATGFPTRTEQSDLMFIIHSGHGEFPRIVFAPGTPQEAFYLTNKAFDLSEKYQVPVFILIDQYIADSEWTYKSFDYKKLIYNDYRAREDYLKLIPDYKRYAYTESGVSPIAIPGTSKHFVVVDSDEHDEEGHIVEDIATRLKMVNKRLIKKLPLIQSEISPPIFYGADNPEVIVTCWGSTYGVVKDAIDMLDNERGKLNGKRIGMLHFSQVYPLPLKEKFDFIKLLEETPVTICVENNATGQFASLLRRETGYAFTHRINKFDGRPFILENLTEEIYDYIK